MKSYRFVAFVNPLGLARIYLYEKDKILTIVMIWKIYSEANKKINGKDVI